MLSTILNNYKVRKYEIINSNISKVQDNSLNNFPIYVINLKTDKTRRNYIKNLFKKHKINYYLIVVEKFEYRSIEDRINIKQKDPILGCILSHLWCIKNAIYKKYERFIIFEDDVIFHKNFDYLFKKIMDSYIENIDLLMLGALDTDQKTNLKNFSNDDLIYYPTTNILGAHSNIYKLGFAKEFFEYKINSKQVLEFDFDYKLFMDKFKIGICMPNLVVCELSTTNINHNLSPFNISGFERHKRLFSVNFTYDDYEYIVITFINLIKEEIDIGNHFNSLQEMVEMFETKCCRRNSKHISKYILNSGYTVDNILEIINSINDDTY